MPSSGKQNNMFLWGWTFKPISNRLVMSWLLSGGVAFNSARFHEDYACMHVQEEAFQMRGEASSQWSPTPGLWTDTGPWVIWYRPAHKKISNLHYFVLFMI